MSKPQTHTPGPWTAKRCRYGWHIGLFMHGVCSIRDNSDGTGRDEDHANARLIAAAPDLLAALEALVASSGGSFDPGCPCEMCRLIPNARAAIAKAKGSQPDVTTNTGEGAEQ